MIHFHKMHILFSFLLIIISNLAHAACIEKGGGFWETSDNTAAAVNECIALVSPGDTINVIAGDGVANWGKQAVTIVPSKQPLNLIGPGKDKLTINLDGSHVIYVQPYQGSAYSPGTRISGFKFVSPLDRKCAALWMYGQGWRVDNCEYHSIESSNSLIAGVFINATALNTSLQPFGLIDNNVVTNGKIDISGGNNWTNMSKAWQDDLNIGS